MAPFSGRVVPLVCTYLGAYGHSSMHLFGSEPVPTYCAASPQTDAVTGCDQHETVTKWLTYREKATPPQLYLHFSGS